MKFPKEFIWGAASASYQIEGGWNADGKGPSIWDDFCHQGGHVQNNETGDVACDSYHRFLEDVQAVADMGLDVYRFSVSWPRIIPDGDGAINPAGLAYYDKVVDALRARGIEPYVTLYHWDLPAALEQKGGWRNRDTAVAFARYAEIVVKHFEGRVTHYMTFNEPQCTISLGYMTGVHAPGMTFPTSVGVRAMHNLLIGHGLAVRTMRAAAKQPLQIGLVSTGKLCYPETEDAACIKAADQACFIVTADDWAFTHTWLLDPAVLGHYPITKVAALNEFAASVPPEDLAIIAQPLDFLGINVYNGHEIRADGTRVAHYTGFPQTALKWPVTPKVMNKGLVSVYQRYQLPIYITENGLSCNDWIYSDGKIHDRDRIEFLTQYLAELSQAVNDGTPIKGYFQWSLCDNFEWHSGYGDRFGLLYLDYRTGDRYWKDSAYWYRDFVAQQRN